MPFRLGHRSASLWLGPLGRMTRPAGVIDQVAGVGFRVDEILGELGVLVAIGAGYAFEGS